MIDCSNNIRNVPIFMLVIAFAVLLLWTFGVKNRTAMIRETAKNRHGAKRRTPQRKKGKGGPTNRPVGWSKLFPERTRTAVVIIDVNNVRGVDGFQSGDVTAFCECTKIWADDIARYINATTSGEWQLRVLLAVDHGPHEAVYDLPQQIRSADVVVSFAGNWLTADDTIVEAVKWFLQDHQWSRLTEQSDESNHQLMVVTNDRELRNRCYEAAVNANCNDCFTMLKSVVFSDWLDRGSWQEYRHRHPSISSKQANKYETTRQREHQAQALFERLEQNTTAHPPKKSKDRSIFSSCWIWPRVISFTFLCWYEMKAKAQTEKEEASRGVVKQVINEWLQQKKRNLQQAEAGVANLSLNMLKSYQERRTRILEDVTEEMKRSYIAMDCEMVGIGKHGVESALARVSIVDWNLDMVFDTYVKVPVPVTDYRTIFSGIQPHHIDEASNAMEFGDCRRRVASILMDKVLVGHGLVNDLTALGMDHPRSCIRDTTRYEPFQRENPVKKKRYRPRRLRDLVRENIPGREGFQQSSHDSLEDARAVMELYQIVWKVWEEQVTKKASAARVLNA